MRHYIHIPFAAALLAALVAGCQSNDAENAQAEAREAQVKAEEKIAEVQARADEKIAEVQAKADDKIAQQQEKVEKEARRADIAFINARNDLRDKAQRRLDDLSKKADEADAKISAAGKRTHDDFRAALADIDATRQAVKRDIASLEVVPPGELTTMEDTLRARLDILDKQLRDLSSRL